MFHCFPLSSFQDQLVVFDFIMGIFERLLDLGFIGVSQDPFSLLASGFPQF
jgi:hypothetical protein